jgi:hypothetical protein
LYVFVNAYSAYMYDKTKSTAWKLPKCASHAAVTSTKKFSVLGSKVSFLNDFGGHSNMTSHTFIETYLAIVEFACKLELYGKPKKILSASLLAIVRKDTGGRGARNKTLLNATSLHVQKSVQKLCGKL